MSKIIPLQGEQAEESCFPVHCPVYITAAIPDSPAAIALPPQIIARGTVTEVLLQMGRSHSAQNLELLYRVTLSANPYYSSSDKHEQHPCPSDLFRQSFLRFCNGCPVYVNFNGNIEEEADTVRWWKGIILGMSDIPISDDRRKYTSDQFLYSVELLEKDVECDDDGCPTILQDVSPSQIKFRFNSSFSTYSAADNKEEMQTENDSDNGDGEQGENVYEDQSTLADQVTPNSSLVPNIGGNVKQEQEQGHQEQEQDQEDSIATNSIHREPSPANRVKLEFDLDSPHPPQHTVVREEQEVHEHEHHQSDAELEKGEIHERQQDQEHEQSHGQHHEQERNTPLHHQETTESFPLHEFRKKRKAREHKNAIDEQASSPEKLLKRGNGDALNPLGDNGNGDDDMDIERDSSDDEMDIERLHGREVQQTREAKGNRGDANLSSAVIANTNELDETQVSFELVPVQPEQEKDLSERSKVNDDVVAVPTTDQKDKTQHSSSSPTEPSQPPPPVTSIEQAPPPTALETLKIKIPKRRTRKPKVDSSPKLLPASSGGHHEGNQNANSNANALVGVGHTHVPYTHNQFISPSKLSSAGSEISPRKNWALKPPPKHFPFYSIVDFPINTTVMIGAIIGVKGCFHKALMKTLSCWFSVNGNGYACQLQIFSDTPERVENATCALQDKVYRYIHKKMSDRVYEYVVANTKIQFYGDVEPEMDTFGRKSIPSSEGSTTSPGRGSRPGSVSSYGPQQHHGDTFGRRRIPSSEGSITSPGPGPRPGSVSSYGQQQQHHGNSYRDREALMRLTLPPPVDRHKVSNIVIGNRGINHKRLMRETNCFQISVNLDSNPVYIDVCSKFGTEASKQACEYILEHIEAQLGTKLSQSRICQPQSGCGDGTGMGDF